MVGSSTDWVMARYEADGTLDSTFGTGGKVTLDWNGGADNAWGLALTPDGKIVASGNETDGSGQRFAVARFNPDGSLDTDFNTTGMVTGFAAGSHAYAVKVDGLGRITAAGDDGGDFALARYEPDGSLDTGFGSSGTITTDFGSGDWAFSIALTSDGGVIAAGTSGSSFALARYAPGGTAKQRLYAEQDANYNVTSLVDTSGSVVQRFAYDPYGADQVLDLGFGATTDAYDWMNRFQGGRLQTATGTYDFRNRVYSPTLGRWLQQDNAGGYVDGLNLYQYTRSQLVDALDPFGLAKGDKSPEEYDEHVRKMEDAKQRLKELKDQRGSASGKKLQEKLQKEADDLESDIKGHEKEIKQKWPNGRPTGTEGSAPNGNEHTGVTPPSKPPTQERSVCRPIAPFVDYPGRPVTIPGPNYEPVLVKPWWNRETIEYITKKIAFERNSFFWKTWNMDLDPNGERRKRGGVR